MKIEKNKMVFMAALLCIILFIGAYGVMTLGGQAEPIIENNRIPIPELEDGQETYRSKLEALDALKEERETNAPSVYDERLLDSTGVYDPDLLDREKRRIVDSIYKQGRIRYTDRELGRPSIHTETDTVIKDTAKEKPKDEIPMANIHPNALSLEHQLFFASNPLDGRGNDLVKTDSLIYVRVDGTQTVRANQRLQMRLTSAAEIGNVPLPKNTLLYGVVSFKPNRTVIDIESINHKPIKLKAYDLQDGREGIYTENSFRSEARREVIEDVVDDVNVAGLPQINGIKRIFRRNNRNVKVTINDNYKLILKPTL